MKYLVGLGVFYLLLCVLILWFPFGLYCPFYVFDGISSSFICFKRICSCLLKHSHEICFTLIIRWLWHDSSCQFFIFSHSSCDFLILVWQVIFNCIFGHFSYFVQRFSVLYKYSSLVLLFTFDMQTWSSSGGCSSSSSFIFRPFVGFLVYVAHLVLLGFSLLLPGSPKGWKKRFSKPDYPVS